jgi:phage/plasmid-associated DNA primase
MPSFSGSVDRGVRRRLLMLQFNRTIPPEERIQDIGKRIAEEEPDLLLAFAVEGASRLIRNRRFTTPPSSEDALAQWLQDADPVYAWVAARVDPWNKYQSQNKTPAYKTSHAHAMFREWALSNGFQEKSIPSLRQFPDRLSSQPNLLRKAYIKHCKSGNWLYGVSIRSEDKPKDDEETSVQR